MRASIKLSNRALIESKLALINLCCYGLTSSGLCVTDSAVCIKRFINRGWSMCCNAG